MGMGKGMMDCQVAIPNARVTSWVGVMMRSYVTRHKMIRIPIMNGLCLRLSIEAQVSDMTFGWRFGLGIHISRLFSLKSENHSRLQ